MKEQHIKWASSHDWYIGHGVDASNQVFVRVRDDYYLRREGRWVEDTHDFTSYQALREWAGY